MPEPSRLGVPADKYSRRISPEWDSNSDSSTDGMRSPDHNIDRKNMKPTNEREYSNTRTGFSAELYTEDRAQAHRGSVPFNKLSPNDALDKPAGMIKSKSSSSLQVSSPGPAPTNYLQELKARKAKYV